MPVFRDTEHIYGVLDAFFTRLAARPDISGALLNADFVLRFWLHRA